MSTKVPEKILTILADQPWEEITARLTYYALRESKRLYWQGILNGAFPGGLESKDIVAIAIEKVLKGERNWNPDTHPNLLYYLKGVIDSDLNHLAESEENRVLRSESVLSDAVDCNEDAPKTGYFDKLATSMPHPEEVFIQKELEKKSDEFLWGLYDFLNDTPVLQKIVECIIDGIDKPSDIAGTLGMPVKDIYNLKKKLQRRLEEYWKKQP